MVGRTPEYLGKKITTAETRLAVLYALLMPAIVLRLTGLALSTNGGRAGLVTNGGSHGFTEVIFAYASSMANNGQNMASLNANSAFLQLDHCRRYVGWTIRTRSTLGSESPGQGERQSVWPQCLYLFYVPDVARVLGDGAIA
jgi:hypothetical protein